MKRTASIAELIYSCSIGIAFLPFIILICGNACIAALPVLLQTFCLASAAVFLNRFTPKKYCRLLSPVYTIILTAISFILENKIIFFYRTLISAAVFLLCLLAGSKRKMLIHSVYSFAGISFADVIICFILEYSFPEQSLIIPVASYLIFASSYGFMSYCKSNADFFKKNENSKLNAAILLIPFSTLVLTAIISFPISNVMFRIFHKILRLMFGGVGGGNTSKPQTESSTVNEQLPDVAPIDQVNIVKCMFIALVFAILLFFIIYLRNEIAEFLINIPLKIKRKIKSYTPESILSYDEYTDIISHLPQVQQINIINEIPPKKMWKKKLKVYHSEIWSEQKLKDGFELAENGLRLCGIEINDNDTVLDIERKLPNELIIQWKKVAYNYINFKYNTILPPQTEQVFFDNLLEAIKNHMKINKI